MARANLEGAASGVLTGAGTGLSIGGPTGGVVGGITGLIGGLFGGGRKKKKKRSTLDKRQQQLNEQQYQSIIGEGPLADLYNYDPEQANAVFDQNISRPAYRNFQENIVPTITGQFRNEGLQNSSYAGQALSRAGRDVQEGLDAKRSQYLYGEQQDARTARRGAVENLQNRNTMAYDYTGDSGNSIDRILKSIPTEAIDSLREYFGKKPEAGVE